MSKFKAVSKKILKWSLIGTVVLGGALTVTVVVLERRTYDPGYPAIQRQRRPGGDRPGPLPGARRRPTAPAATATPRRKADFLAGRDGPLTRRGGVPPAHRHHSQRQHHRAIARPASVACATRQIARSLRFGVGRDGRALAPFMPFANLSDEDLTAIISYLRTQAPVRNQVADPVAEPAGARGDGLRAEAARARRARCPPGCRPAPPSNTASTWSTAWPTAPAATPSATCAPARSPGRRWPAGW